MSRESPRWDWPYRDRRILSIGPLAIYVGGAARRILGRYWIPDGLNLWWGDHHACLGWPHRTRKDGSR